MQWGCPSHETMNACLILLSLCSRFFDVMIDAENKTLIHT